MLWILYFILSVLVFIAGVVVGAACEDQKSPRGVIPLFIGCAVIMWIAATVCVRYAT